MTDSKIDVDDLRQSNNMQRIFDFPLINPFHPCSPRALYNRPFAYKANNKLPNLQSFIPYLINHILRFCACTSGFCETVTGNGLICTNCVEYSDAWFLLQLPPQRKKAAPPPSLLPPTTPQQKKKKDKTRSLGKLNQIYPSSVR